jgi:Ca2+-binding RTX toxin-like protein
METKRPNLEVFNQGDHQSTFGHLPDQVIQASVGPAHHALTSSGKGNNLLIGGQGVNVFQYKSTTTWPGYYSQNTGDPENAGPNTLFTLSGYAQNTDVYHGYAGAANIIWMANGKEALFLDDGYSPGADSLRFTNINFIQCGTGDQLVDLTSPRYALGNVTITGGTGNDVLMSSSGNDTLVTGKGNDYLWGGSGNDTLVYDASKSAGFSDTLIGASGIDTLRIQLTSAQYTTAVRNEIQAFHNFLSGPANNGQTFHFDKLGNLDATGFERLDLMVDAHHIAPAAPGAKQTIHASNASHSVTGGTGADTFYWTLPDTTKGGPDHITHFSFEQLDRIDLSRIVADRHPASINDVVHVIDTAEGSLIQAHVKGASGWSDIAVLDDIHAVTAANLWASHSLII